MRNQIAEIQLKYKNKVKKGDRIKISNSNEVYKTLLGLWDTELIELQEQFWLLVLNRANEVIGSHCLSTGGTAGTIVEIKLIVLIAIKSNACSIIVSHNHPSGNLKPSQQDIKLTDRIKQAAKYFEIELLDHLIVTYEGYYSFVDEGMMN